MRTIALTGVAVLFATAAGAQQPTRVTAPTSVHAAVLDTGMFAHLNLRPGDLVRTADGRPGPKYWQQKVSYNITATLDTAAKRLSGHERITYQNNSPLPLRHVYIQLD